MFFEWINIFSVKKSKFLGNLAISFKMQFVHMRFQINVNYITLYRYFNPASAGVLTHIRANSLTIYSKIEFSFFWLSVDFCHQICSYHYCAIPQSCLTLGVPQPRWKSGSTPNPSTRKNAIISSRYFDPASAGALTHSCKLLNQLY